MNAPLVSILINNYNYGRFLSDALDSALAQGYPEVEVVVVDDGSTDDSRSLLEPYAARVVTVLQENGGQGSAFNAGFRASRGSIICFLDADDWFLPEKAAAVVAAFGEHPDCGWLVHGLRHVDGDGRPTALRERTAAAAAVRSGDYRPLVRAGRERGLPWLPATSALCFRRELLQRILPVPLSLRITADNYLKCAALLTSPMLALEEELALQRIHGNNAYSNIDRKDPAFRKLARSVTREVSRGLHLLDRGQLYSVRLALRNLKMSVEDRDSRDTLSSFAECCRYLAAACAARALFPDAGSASDRL